MTLSSQTAALRARKTGIWALLAFCILMLSGVSAHAQTGKLLQVLPESLPGSLEFTFIADTEIDGSKAEAIPDKDPSVLILRLDGIKTKRKWVKFKDPLVKRILLHPSKQMKNAAVLRIRFKKAIVDRDLMKRITVYVEDAGIRIGIPRPAKPSDKVAKTPAGKPTVSKDAPTAGANKAKAKAKAAVKKPKATAQNAGSRPAGSSSQPATNAANGQNAASGAPDGQAPTDGSAATPEADGAADGAVADPGATNDAGSLVLLPGTRTRDVLAGYADLVLRLETGMRHRPGIHRIAVFPFISMDKAVDKTNLADVSEAVITDRLIKRPGVVQAHPDLVGQTIMPLKRDDMGRIALDEARAAGLLVGADTLIVGTVGRDGNGFLVDARAVDVETGRRLSVASQEFDGPALAGFSDQVQDRRTYLGTLGRSAVMPGWGQVYQRQPGRGAAYSTLFGATLLAGITSAIVGSVHESQYQESSNRTDLSERRRADKAFASANGFFASAAMVWLTAMADSLFNGKEQLKIDIDRYGAPE